MCNKTAARSPSSAGAEHKPILAERFKTKMCQNFIKTGICPYEVRCMFAHGEHELRNKEMNLRDKLVTEDAIKNFQRAKMIADRSMERKKKRLSQAAAAESSSHAEEKEDDETNTLKQNPATPKEPSTPAVPVRKTPAHAANTPPTRPRSERRTSTSFVAALEPHAITPETPETVGSIKSPDVEGREPVPIKGLDLASPAVVSPSRRYRHDPYAPVALLPVAAAAASEPPAAVVTCVAKPQLATCRSRPLPVPPPLCAVALRDTPLTATSAPDSATRVMTPSISPLAQVMGRQASASYYNRAMPATPLVSPPVAATPAPPTPLTHVTEYKTTYGAPSIVASHAVLLA